MDLTFQVIARPADVHKLVARAAPLNVNQIICPQCSADIAVVGTKVSAIGKVPFACPAAECGFEGEIFL